MKKLIIILALFLSGCATQVVPSKFTFPEPPVVLMTAPELTKELPEGPLVLSTVTESIIQNYIIAYNNRIQLESLQEWIKKQQSIYNKK